MKKLLCGLLVAVLLLGSPVGALLPQNSVVITAEAATAGKVALSKKSVSLAVAGKTTVQLKNVGSKKKVTWSTSNKKVATVKKGSNGKVTITGKKAGTAKITAKYNGKKYSVKVTVKAPALSKKSLSLNVGKSGTITLKNTVSSKKVTWKSSKTSVATVKAGKNGKVTITAKKAGTATITATYNKKKYTCKLTVKGKTAAPKLSKTSLSITVGKSDSITLNNTVKGKKVTAKSSSTKVAAVKVSSNKIMVTGKAKGSCTVTVSYNGKSYKCSVKVSAKATTTPVKQPETQPSKEDMEDSSPTQPTKPSTPTTEPTRETEAPVKPSQPSQPSTEPTRETEAPAKPTTPTTPTTEPQEPVESEEETEADKPVGGDNGNNGDNGGETLAQWWDAPVGSYLVVDVNTIYVRLTAGTNGTARTITSEMFQTDDPNIKGNRFSNKYFNANAPEGIICSYDAVKDTGSLDGSTIKYTCQFIKGDLVGYYNYNGSKVPMYRLIQKIVYENGNTVVNTTNFDTKCSVLVCYCGAEFHQVDYADSSFCMKARQAHAKLDKDGDGEMDTLTTCGGYQLLPHFH
ncbi:MAG: Ig-like domain-containing protein [Lachnospiraceae bacterium]|nr:Ig-like domain-containing protein [Lachnospiraceae bacterium]